jgi:hypothetical protein
MHEPLGSGARPESPAASHEETPMKSTWIPLTWTPLALLLGLVVPGCSELGATSKVTDATQPKVTADDDDDDEDEVDVDLSQVPQNVKAAAAAAVPGFTATSAERETGSNGVVYCLEGTANGEPCEIEVTEGGTVQEIEHGDDDDEHDDDEDDD